MSYRLKNDAQSNLAGFHGELPKTQPMRPSWMTNDPNAHPTVPTDNNPNEDRWGSYMEMFELGNFDEQKMAKWSETFDEEISERQLHFMEFTMASHAFNEAVEEFKAARDEFTQAQLAIERAKRRAQAAATEMIKARRWVERAEAGKVRHDRAAAEEIEAEKTQAGNAEAEKAQSDRDKAGNAQLDQCGTQ
ncbi:MAG: hypothetical protein Q9159_003833 [Coniocarpon cinnabarinum]